MIINQGTGQPQEAKFYLTYSANLHTWDVLAFTTEEALIAQYNAFYDKGLKVKAWRTQPTIGLRVIQPQPYIQDKYPTSQSYPSSTWSQGATWNKVTKKWHA